ncbi:hypothetical protein PCANC_23483 [Puccinia coronata f. sp. avenae]|uniref:Uncharacterized protein n=1 Tax=Puccinia coronata f. sp. avenae TaxID=200324 RepID=A0A2N5TT83_9BASI|nr:hypothetical protein PCANC_23483 [Puccinia coronata f. sp. avenae]PLW45494.1 hypothetical protein PCASD_05960 [Puccinia coronata f. sp. avenae]
MTKARELGFLTGALSSAPPKGLYRLQPPAARSVAATDVTSVYQTDVTSAAPTDTLCLCSNVSVGPADIKSVWATDVTSVASGRPSTSTFLGRRNGGGRASQGGGDSPPPTHTPGSLGDWPDQSLGAPRLANRQAKLS